MEEQTLKHRESKPQHELGDVVIRFAGDSGDGIQLIGSEFTKATAFAQNDLGTLPDYPAEIRAPAGTMAGVSGFQIHFGSSEIFTPGDKCDVLVVMNAAALRKNLGYLKSGGFIIANEDGFDAKNLRLAGYPEDAKPLDEEHLQAYQLHKLPITKLTKEALLGLGLGTKEVDRSKNMFVLGLIYWLYSRHLEATEKYITKKFANSESIANANLITLKAGYNYGETTEVFSYRYHVAKAKMAPGEYREISGNQGVALGLVLGASKAGTTLFYGSYPITPASDILHELARLKHLDVVTFQAEDEIAAICSALGASYGGKLGATASSGPGIDLKTETLGLAVMLEQPLIMINVQRAGPSTGMPTKTEQTDLLQAFFGRHGEAPLPILAPKSPSDCFDITYEATRIAMEYMTPVIILSDAFLANGSEPWAFPKAHDLPKINPPFATSLAQGEKFQPYLRSSTGVRPWMLPGTLGGEHRLGGLEKEEPTGNISYDPKNHEKMVTNRATKVANIALHIPKATLDSGPENGSLLLLGWGSTYGAIKASTISLRESGHRVSHLHFRYLNPMPDGVGEILKNFTHILLPENNTGQLSLLLRAKYLLDIKSLSKVQGLPFAIEDIVQASLSILDPSHYQATLN